MVFRHRRRTIGSLEVHQLLLTSTSIRYKQSPYYRGDMSMTRTLRQISIGFVFASLLFVLHTRAQQGAKNGEWRAYGGDEASTRYSPLDQINRNTLKNMRVAWVWKSDSLRPNPASASETTPLMVNGVLYFTMDDRRYVIAADAGTGDTLWIYRPNETGDRFALAPRKVHR